MENTSDKKYGVLIVDDEPDICESLEVLLESNDYKCFSATSASSGFEVLEKNLIEIDVVLTDIIMPGESGIEMISRIHKSTYAVPIIILSGYNDKEVTKQALRLGVFDMVDKPYNSDHLLEVINEAIRVSEQQYSLVEQSNVRKDIAALASLKNTEDHNLPELDERSDDLYWDMAKGQIEFCIASIGVIQGSSDRQVYETELSYIIRVLNALSESSNVELDQILFELVNALQGYCSNLRVNIAALSPKSTGIIGEGLEHIKAKISGQSPDLAEFYSKIK